MDEENEDYKWAVNGLHNFQRQEIEAVERIKKAEVDLANAKKELADAKESLKGIRGCIVEMEYQRKYFEEHGKLP